MSDLFWLAREIASNPVGTFVLCAIIIILLYGKSYVNDIINPRLYLIEVKLGIQKNGKESEKVVTVGDLDNCLNKFLKGEKVMTEPVCVLQHAKERAELYEEFHRRMIEHLTPMVSEEVKNELERRKHPRG